MGNLGSSFAGACDVVGTKTQDTAASDASIMTIFSHASGVVGWPTTLVDFHESLSRRLWSREDLS